MKRLIYCTFNMYTACVELLFSDGSRIAVYTVGVENEVADNLYQRSELDWLIYNKPLEYARLVLGGESWRVTYKGRRSIDWKIERESGGKLLMRPTSHVSVQTF